MAKTIKQLLKNRKFLIKKRNKLVDKPFYLLRFWLHSQTKRIDAQINDIDKQIKILRQINDKSN